MSENLRAVLAANKEYAANFGNKGSIPHLPTKRLAVVTCMDSRIDPAKSLGFNEGDAHIIRNAGGRATDDVIRSLVISYKLLGTLEWFVIQHTHCGMRTFTNLELQSLLADSLAPVKYAEHPHHNPTHDCGSSEAYYMNFLPFRSVNESIVEDVRRIRSHPLVPSFIPIYAYIYDVETGRLIESKEAMAIGKAGDKI